jgi:outer membrane protein OmpA-like peptidoglycan-associated protein
MLGSRLALFSQSVLSPQELTNRPLAIPNDASAIGWNPSLLGTRSSTYDFIAAMPFGIGEMLPGTPFAAFAKFGPAGIGMTSGHNDSLLPFSQYYAAYGWPAIQGRFWVGVGLRLLYEDSLLHGGIVVSGTVRPSSKLMTSLSLIDPTGTPSASIGAAYNLNDQITFLASLLYDGLDTTSVQSRFRPSLGASITAAEHININGMVDVANLRFRLGAEINFAGFGLGTIGAWHNGDGVTGGIGYVRYSTDRTLPHSDESYGVPAPIVRSASILGWAPMRAFTPSGFLFGRTSSDAKMSLGSLALSCAPEDREVLDRPADLVREIGRAGADYAPLARRLDTLAPTPGKLYHAIRQRYYSTQLYDNELGHNDTLEIVSRQGYSIGIQSVDYSAFPRVSVMMQVANDAGRNVAGLDADDFSFRDTTRRIISVQPIGAQRNVPVDVVLVIDCSGSMTQKIAAVRENVENFLNRMESRGANYRIGGVLYGAVIYDTLSPTANFATFRDFVANAEAIGGDEISSLAIKVASQLSFRPNARKVFVLVTDDWAIQENARLTEADLTAMLWNIGARLYTIINPCHNNSAVMTRMTLGTEYDIQAPFNSILDELSTDITTVYQLVYESHAPAPPSVALVRGQIRDCHNAPVGAAVTLLDTAGTVIQSFRSDGATGEFELKVQAGQRYKLVVDREGFPSQSEPIDLTQTGHGVVVDHNIVFRHPLTLLAGMIRDESGAGVVATIRVEEAATLTPVTEGESDSTGRFEVSLPPGNTYRITAICANHVPTPVEIDMREVECGAHISQDLRVTSVTTAINTGETFVLKNIFFDYDKWEIRPESIPELNRLVMMLNANPAVRVEIDAHTDAHGAEDYNITLSENRARSVVDYLVNSGVAMERLGWRGYGKSMPIATNETDEGRQLNRRVEFKLVK